MSSTGHLIVAGSLLGYTGEQAKVFEIVIQAGAILAVCWEYRARLASVLRGLFSEPRAQRFALNLFVAFLPAAVIGLALGKAIKAHLFAPVPVAGAFVVGALVILWVERRQKARPATVRIDSVDAMTLDRRAEGRMRAVLRADPGHVALRRDDHRRHAVRALACRRHRILVLPRDPDAVRGDRVLAVEGRARCSARQRCPRSASASSRHSSRRSPACAG